MKNISIMIKPSSSSCNLACDYCFYHDVASCRLVDNYGIMTTDTAKTIIDKALEYSDGGYISITFQGGEPLLSSKEFYREFFEYLKANNIKKSTLNLSIQTNGTLIDSQWAQIFKDNNILIGISLDGDRVANIHRKYSSGEPTFQKVIDAINVLKEYAVDYNIISVLTRQNVARLDKVLAFYRRHDMRYLQFVPCLMPLQSDRKTNIPTAKVSHSKPLQFGKASGQSTQDKCKKSEYSDTSNDQQIKDKICQIAEDICLTPQQYGEALVTLWHEYMQENSYGKHLSIRYFDNLINLHRLGWCEQCGVAGKCASQLVIESDGKAYPCDFYCLDEHCLGNVNDKSLDELVHVGQSFVQDNQYLHEECKDCQYFRLCRGGGCKREKLSADYCQSYKRLFEVCYMNITRLRLCNFA